MNLSHSPISLSLYIKNIADNISDTNSDAFCVACSDFISFIETEYKEAVKNSVESAFIDALFLQISPNVIDDQKLSMKLLSLVCNAEIGNKISKANRLSREIVNLKAFSDKDTANSIKRVLLYISKNVGKSIQLVLVPIREYIWTWLMQQNPEEMVGALYLLNINFKYLYQYFRNNFGRTYSTVLNCLQNPNKEVRAAAYEIINTALKFPEEIAKDNIEQYAAKIVQIVNSMVISSTDLINVVEYIFRIRPEFIPLFNFQKFPTMFINSKEPELMKIGFSIIPIFYLTNRELLSKEIPNVYKVFYDALSKQSPVFDSILRSFGAFILAHHGEFTKDEENEISNFKTIIMNNIRTKYGAYAFISAKITSESNVGSVCEIVKKLPMDIGIRDALCSFIKVYPGTKQMLQSLFVDQANKKLFNPNITPFALSFYFTSFEMLEIPMSFFNKDVVIGYSMHLDNSDFQIKKDAMKFILKYHNENPTLPVLIRILTALQSEVNEQRKVKVLRKLKIEPVRELSIQPLRSLLYGSCFTAAREVFKAFLKFICFPEAYKIVNDYLSECYTQICEYNILHSKYLVPFISSFEKLLDPCFGDKDALKNILKEYISDLSKTVLNPKTVTTSLSLRLLRLITIVDHEKIDEEKLVLLLNEALTSHSSPKKLNEALNMLETALNYTSISKSIYGKDSSLIAKVHLIAKLPEDEVNHENILKILAKIGALSADFVRDKTDKLLYNKKNNITRNTPKLFINKCPTYNPKENIQYAATGVILSNIFDILSDDSLEQLHSFAIDAFLLILKTNKAIDPALIDESLNRIKNFLVSENASSTTIILSNLASIIALFGYKYAPLVSATVDFICKEWKTANKATLLRITEWMMMNVPETLAPHNVRLATVFLSDLLTVDNKSIEMIFNTFLSFGNRINSIQHIIYPSLLETITRTSLETELCGLLVDKLKLMLSYTGASMFSASIIRAMVNVVHNNKELNDQCLKVVAAVAVSIGDVFMLYYPMVKKSFNTDSHAKFNIIVDRLSKKQKIPDTVIITCLPPPISKTFGKRRSVTVPVQKKQIRAPLKPKIASSNWDEHAWYTWFDDAFTVLLKNSALRTISATTTLVQKYPVLRNTLYPLAFVCEYVEQMDFPATILNDILSSVFNADRIPAQILRSFISVIELLDTLGVQHPISTEMLAKACVKAGDLPIAIKCYELLLETGRNDVAETLIDLNMRVNNVLSANGLLDYSRIYKIPISHESNAEKLGLWEEALNDFTNKLEDDPDNMELLNSKMKCLSWLMRFREIVEEPKCSQDYLAIAYFYTNQIDKFMETKPSEDTFYRMLQRTINGEDLTNHLEMLKKECASSLFPALSDNYGQNLSKFKYPCLITELQEVIRYNKLKKIIPAGVKDENTLEMQHIIDVWDSRFEFIQQDPMNILGHICVRSLAIGMEKQKKSIIKFIDTAINAKRFSIAESVIDTFINSDEELKKEKFRLLIASGRNDEAFDLYNNFFANSENKSKSYSEVESIISDYYYEKNMYNEAYEHLHKSLEIAQNTNTLAISERVNMALYQETHDVKYLHESFKASLQGLIIDQEHSIGFMLNILKIFFTVGSPEISKIFTESLSKLPTQPWIKLLPQVVALSYSEDVTLRNVIYELIYTIGLNHPQPVIYALMVPSTSHNKSKVVPAKLLLDKLRPKYSKIVQTIENLTNELVSVAINWHEYAITTIDEISKSWNDGDVEHTKKLIKQFNKEVKHDESSFNEISFFTYYGSILQQASSNFKAYCKTNDTLAMNAALKLYAEIYTSCKKYVDSITEFPLSNASANITSIIPKSTIIVPGTYNVGSTPIYLEKIEENVKVMISKQKPRRIKMLASNGTSYYFLLKAHEDTRLDERVMQLFSFVNTLVRASDIAMKQYLSITTYEVTPLTSNVGLIGWVSNCTSLFEVIKQQREKNKIPLYAEMDAIKKLAPNYDTAPYDKKLRAFIYGLRTTKGTDIREAIYSGSADSYHWLERRTVYSTSLSMTSMIGYILGLGDRHVENIMINHDTSKLVHIDFGDCFEVAMERTKLPEKVPFRLTRNLQNALEVSKIEGTFRKCSENILALVRGNKDEILGMLHAFIYDPLNQWKEEGSAQRCIDRISDKLKGMDNVETSISAKDQVDVLIKAATDNSNLCQMYTGWCAFW